MSPAQSCPSSHSAAGVVPGTVNGAVMVAPNVVVGSVEAMGVVGGAAVVMSDEEDGQLVSVFYISQDKLLLVTQRQRSSTRPSLPV